MSLSTFLDFERSFFWFTINVDQMTRIKLDARAVITDRRAGVTQEYFLLSPCQGERMWKPDFLAQNPPYTFGGVASRTEAVFFRTWAGHKPDRPTEAQYVPHLPYFNKTELVLRPTPTMRRLAPGRETTEALKSHRRVGCRTKVGSADGRFECVLEYPLETVNLLISDDRVQVDTGVIFCPVWADPAWKSPPAQHTIEDLRQAFVLYNTLDTADFVLRVPTQVEPGGGKTWHYSHGFRTAAVNEVFLVE